MFLSILNWMIANVPGFARPLVNWLVEGLRKITGHIAARWNALGRSAGAVFSAVAALRGHLATFVQTTLNAVWWLRNVYIPRFVNTVILSTLRAVNDAINAARNAASRAVLALERWASDRLAALGRLIDGISRWAREQLARLTSGVDRLITALRHVMSGPALLAEWLAGEMWKALLRRAFSQRDRIVTWLLRESVATTRWLAATLEDVIVRML